MVSSVQNANRKRVLQMLDLFNSKYDCKVCRKKLRYKADQIIHHKLKHATGAGDRNSRDNFKCPFCDKKHNSYFKLMTHLMINHLKEKPYGCKICKKKFLSFLKFKRHCQNTHSEVNLLNLIEYDNSELVLADNHKHNNLALENEKIASESKQIQPMIVKINDNLSSYYTTNSQIKYTKFLDKIKLSEIIVKPNYIEISDNKLNNTKYEDIFTNDKRKLRNKSMSNSLFQYNNQEEEEENENLDLETKNIDEHVFTIITQFNLQNCPQCDKAFITNSDFLNHMWKIHMINEKKPTKFECWSCCLNAQHRNSDNHSYKFKNEIELIKHLRSSHLEELPYKCSMCSDSFDDLNSTIQHYHQKHLLNKNDLENGLIMMRNDENENYDRINCKFVFACSYCEQIYKDHQSITEHFSDNRECNLNSHLLLGKTMRLFKCEYCNNEYMNESTLNIHLDQHEYLQNNRFNNHAHLSPPAIIKKPSRIFENKNNYNNNIHNSSNNKSFRIDAIVSNECNSKPASQHQIIQSNNSLSNDNNNNNYNPNVLNGHNHSSAFRNLKSTLVNSSTINYNNNATQLYLHQKFIIHGKPSFSKHQSSVQPSTSNNNNEQRGPICDLCLYEFRNEIELAMHKHAHIGSEQRRPIRCHLCNIPFAKKELLQRHMYIHLVRDKDFICCICLSTFSRKQDLDRHIQFHRRL
jgi:hypothetical protein